MTISMWRRLTAEFVGSAFLVATVVGSGIMGERLANGNVALALLANTIATGAALVALILTFGPISGAHFNPAVTLADAVERGLSWGQAWQYALVQIVGAITGAVIAHLMFGLPPIVVSRHARNGSAQFLSWPALGELGLLTRSVKHGAFRGGSLHNGGLLVYIIDFLRESGSNHREITERHVRRDSAC